MTDGKNSDEAFKNAVSKIEQPTFVKNHPTDLLPLAKRNEANPKVVDSFQLIIAGMELVKAYSELNDPIDQRERLEAQALLKEQGDEEAQPLDENFIRAMECGMPPTGGVGIVIDRLTMLLTEQDSIKDVILFPAMRTVDE